MDASNATDGRYLIRRLPDFNPWWEDGSPATQTDEFDSLRSAFYDLHKAVVTEERAVHPVVGPDGVGKTTLAKQLISALIDSDFVEKFYRSPEFRSEARLGIVPPEHILYIPFAEEPLSQLHAPAQLRAAIDYYETHYLCAQSNAAPHYILLDDVDTLVTDANSALATRLRATLTDLVTEHPQRTIIFTGTPDISGIIWDEDGDDERPPDRNSMAPTPHRLLPIPVADFLRGRFKELETSSDTEQFHHERAQTAFQNAVQTADPEVFAEQLRTEIANATVPAGDIRREISHYLTVGGYVGQRLVFPIGQREHRFDSVLRGRSAPDIESVQKTVRETLTRMLRIRGPEAGVRGSPSKLVQLAALIATEYPTSSVRFTTLTDLLEVDRRTLRDSLLPVLSRLHLVTPSPEYANQRPRSLRLYHRDSGIANAFADRNLNDVLGADQQLEAALTKSVLFDHTVRLSNSINDPRDPKRGVVKYWVGEAGEVDFIPKIDGRPIPMYWSGQQRLSELMAASDPPDGFQALVSFLQSNAHEADQDPLPKTSVQTGSDTGQESCQAYIGTDTYHGEPGNSHVGDGQPPFGIVLTADRSTNPNPVRVNTPDDLSVPLLEIPQWAYLRMM